MREPLLDAQPRRTSNPGVPCTDGKTKVAFKTNELDSAAGQVAADIDVRCSLAFARAALKAVCALSPEAREAALLALDEEAHAVSFDNGAGTPAVAALINEARQRLAAGEVLAKV